jgi:transposase-like protein
MTKPIAHDPVYRQRAFDADIIQPCVRWYVTYRLSYRDLVEMMAERGKIAHLTILRWVTRYVPEFEKRWNRFSKTVGTSWRVDETYISIKAKWHYLYRAVDKHGKTVDFLLRRDRGIAAAQAFFRKACWRKVKVRTNKYLNNLIEQDHRAIKRRCASMAGFKSFKYAAITIAGNSPIVFARDNSRWVVAVDVVTGRARHSGQWRLRIGVGIKNPSNAT